MTSGDWILNHRIFVVCFVIPMCFVPIAIADTYVGGLPLTTVQNGIVSGGVYMDADNDWWPASPGVQEVEKTFNTIPDVDDIEWARLYVAVYVGHMQSNYPGTAEIEFDGDGDSTLDDLSTTETLNVAYTFSTNGGNDNSGFSGHGTGEPYKMVNEHCIRITSDYVMWYDIDPADITSTEPRAHVTTSGTTIDGRIKLITLVIAYNDGDTDVIRYWVNQGEDAVTYYSDSNTPGDGETGSTNFDLSSLDSFDSATLLVNHMASSDGYYYWMGDQLAKPADSYSQGAYFGWNSWDITSKVAPGEINDLMYDRSCEAGTGEYSGQFYKIPLAILITEKQSVTEPPVTDFNATPLSGEAPLSIQFHDLSSNNPTSWKWEYRLGTGSWTQFATSQHPAYLFTSAGTYSIRLNASNTAGSNIKTKTSYITVNAPATSDLTITNLRPLTNSVFAKEPNMVRTTVKNIGGSASTATTLYLNASDGFSGSSDVPALASNEQTIISILDTTVRNLAGGSVNYTATVDPTNTVTEASESNNVGFSSVYPTKYNGYKGKRYWEGRSDVTTKKTFDLRGGLLYSFGDSTYHSGAVGGSGSGWSAYTVTWTSGDLPLPSGASVVAARLYVPYTWDSSDEMPDHFHITFNGITLTPENHYEDVSNFGGYAIYDYGLLTYNITSLYNAAGNSAYLTKDSVSTNVAMYGVTLAVVYEDPTTTRKQIFINEEFDLLGASENDYATTEEEATAYVPFTGLSIIPSNVVTANLITFVPSGNMNEGDLLFNDATIATDVWDYGSISGPQVAVDVRDISTSLSSTENIVGIRSTAGATPCMAAAQQFLILTYTDETPTAGFSASPISGTTPLSVTFTDTSAGSITSRMWDFGDGNSSWSTTATSFTHIYSSPNTFTVNLTVTGPGGMDSEVKTNYITASAAAIPPIAAFTTSPTHGLSPLPVTFTDQSANTPTSWKWEFKNYNSDWTQFSTDQSPVFSVIPAGTYDIRLTVNNSAGGNVLTKTHVFSVSTGKEPLTTVTNGTVSGGLYVGAYQPVPWGSQPSTGVTQLDFNQTFSIPPSALGNIQWARLFVNTYGGSSTNSYGHRATVTFDGNGDTVYETTLGVEQCDISAEGNGNSYPLNNHVTKVFSDFEAWYDVTGLITTPHPAAHVRTEQIAGKTYDGRLKVIALVVAYNDGDSDQVTYWVNHGQDWINSGTTQTAFATSPVTTGFTDATVKNLAISSKDGRYSFNGIIQSWADPVSPVNYFEFHTWNVTNQINPGTDSTLVYSLGTGSSFKTILSTLEITTSPTQQPIAAFSAYPLSGTAPLEVHFTDASTGSITSYGWDFTNDGTIDSTDETPTYTYQNVGTYTVNLTVTGQGGSDSEVKTGYITTTGASQPDLVITKLSTNLDELFAHESNTINATVRNNGTAASGACNIRIDAAGVIFDVPISSLDPGAQQEIQVTDTTLRTGGDTVTITATVDSGHVVAESDETNNVVSITEIVVNNGYKGKRWTGGSDMTTHATFVGQYDVVYSAGNSVYHATKWLEANATWTAADLPIPAGATVASARLYQSYAYNKMGTDPAFSASFNGNVISPVATYRDIKGYAAYSYPYGLYVYDVTSQYNTAGNTLLLVPEGTPGTTNDYSLYGAYLVVTFIDPAAGDRQILINDEFDMVYAGSARSVSSSEATVYANFSELDTGNMAGGTAVAILASAGDSGKSKFFFNNNEYTGFWTDYMSGPQIGFSVYDVTDALTTGVNEARLQSYDAGSGGDNMYAMTTILIVESTIPAPTAAFTASPLSGTAPLEVHFTDASTGTIVSYAWDFTNDGIIDSTDQNPVHIYQNAGTYTVNLTVSGPSGSDSEVKTQYVSVTEPSGDITANFSASPLAGDSPLIVRFNDQSTGTITKRQWDFNNDGIIDSTTKNPFRLYRIPGVYSVRLEVSGSGGSDQMVKNEYITITAPVKRLIARFNQNTHVGTAPLIVGFTDQSIGTPMSYLWSFDDGATSTEVNPTHTYTTPGLYRVSLTVSNDQGSSTSNGFVFVMRTPRSP